MLSLPCGPHSHNREATHAQTLTPLHHGAQTGALVKVIRESTERFRDVSVAEAEGYALLFGCVSQGAGAMGLHYANPSLVSDNALDPRVPRS